jgi:hypothetical protein
LASQLADGQTAIQPVFDESLGAARDRGAAECSPAITSAHRHAPDNEHLRLQRLSATPTRWRGDCDARRSMSQKTVQFVIGWLLTDEDLRRRFVERPRETLDEVCEQGYELTWDELDALARSDPTAWPAMARRIHPRLQRCPLR